ncbi:MAG: hypothetical protein WBR15_07245 [Gammaproteobacteria bacterium]
MSRINCLCNMTAFPRICLSVVCTLIVCALGSSAFAALLSGAPTQLPFNGIAASDVVGWSAALSSNGKVAVLGGPAVDQTPAIPGAVFVYTETNGTWSNPIPLSLSGIQDNVLAGESVGVTPNGDQAFVGAPIVSTYVGAVYAYTPPNGDWANATPVPLDVTGVPQHSNFGTSLVISGNGQKLVVGATHASDTNNPGAVYVYTLANGSWGTPVQLPTPTALAGKAAQLGTSVAVSNDGTLVVASSQTGTNSTAYVWTYAGGSWTNTATLPQEPASGGNGVATAVSADGTEILMGVGGANSGAGAAYLYTSNGTKWSLTHTFTVANSGDLGFSVGLSPDGTMAFIGMPGGNTGAIYVSFNSNGTWSTPVALSSSGVQGGAGLGWSLAVASNGQTVLGGAANANSTAGDGYVYSSPASINMLVIPAANPVTPGSDATFNLTFTNADTANGSFPATTLTNVVLTDTLPAGTSYVSSDTANGSCSNSGSTVTCTLASLAPGNNSQNPWAPSITVKTPSTAGTLTDIVSASADQPLLGVTNTSTTLTTSSSSGGGSSSSSGGGKSGGALGFLSLGLLGIGWRLRRRRLS